MECNSKRVTLCKLIPLEIKKYQLGSFYKYNKLKTDCCRPKKFVNGVALKQTLHPTMLQKML